MLALAVAVGAVLDRDRLGPLDGAAHRAGRDRAATDAEPARRASCGRACIGVAATWLGVLFAYDSFYWFPSSQGLPVSFFIVALVFLAYLGSGLPDCVVATAAAPPRRDAPDATSRRGGA